MDTQPGPDSSSHPCKLKSFSRADLHQLPAGPVVHQPASLSLTAGEKSTVSDVIQDWKQHPYIFRIYGSGQRNRHLHPDPPGQNIRAENIVFHKIPDKAVERLRPVPDTSDLFYFFVTLDKDI